MDGGGGGGVVIRIPELIFRSWEWMENSQYLRSHKESGNIENKIRMATVRFGFHQKHSLHTEFERLQREKQHAGMS